MSELFASIRSPYRNLDAEAALEKPTSILLGVSQSAANALNDIGISTVFDLASSTLFANAVDICLLAESGEGRFAATGRVPHDALRNGYDKSIKDLLLQPVSVLGGHPSETQLDALAKAIDIASIRDLAAWSPYRTARELLDRVYNPLAISGVLEDLEAPTDLVPDNGQYPTERVQYEVLLFDGIVSEVPLPIGTGGPITGGPIAGGPFGLPNRPDALKPLGAHGALDVAELVSNSRGYERPAIGGVLTFTQSWYTKGLALGNLIHGVALAPGESTKIAMIDWSRRTRTSATEAIQEDEQLVSDLTRTRSISEITSAVAHETQRGASGAKSFVHATQHGVATGAAGLRDPELSPLSVVGTLLTGLPLPISLTAPGVTTSGTSFGTSTGFTDATSWSTSSGDRNVSATLSQDIADRTHQASISARNRRASIVREVSQEESESISTRTLTNYNHMHALTVEYYEVVQLYRTVLELTKADRCLFVPMKMIDFGNRAVVNRFRSIIAAVGLNPQIQALGFLEPDHVGVVAPERIKPWDSLEEVSVATSEFVGTQQSTVIRLPKHFPVTRIRFGFWEEAPIDKIVVTLTSGQSYTFGVQDYGTEGDLRHAPRFEPSSTDLDHFNYRHNENAHDWHDIARVEFVKKSDAESYEGELTIGLVFFGAFPYPPGANYIGATLSTTIKVPKETAKFTVLEFTESVSNEDLRGHLNDNALYYSQAVWRALDPATIGILLSGYTWPVGGQAKPLVELVDPSPVGVVANYLVLRLSGDAAEQHTAWLSQKKLIVPSSLREDLVPVPSGGVFAEAVLGRFNSAEKLDITRFWNWQDSPIPIEAPDIAAIQAGSRAEPDDTTPGQLGAPVLNILNSPALPDPQGMGAVLAAIQNGNMFRDMSGLAATIGLAQAGLAGAQQGATAAASQAGQNAAVAAELGAKVAELAAKIVAAYFTGGASAAAGAGGGGLAGLAGGISGQGAKLNKANEIDNKRGVPSQTSNGTGGSGSGSGGGTAAGSAPSTNTPKVIETFDSFLPGGSSYLPGSWSEVQRVLHGPETSSPSGITATSYIPLDPETGGRSIGDGALDIGDIILSTTPHLDSLGIKLVTDAPVSHAALYIGGGQIVESVKEGVVLRTLGEALSDDSLAVAFRHPSLTAEQALKIRDFAGQKVGKKYDFGVVRQAWFRLDLWSFCRNKSGADYDACRRWVGQVNLGTSTNEVYFCSELVLAAYADAGVPLTATPPHWDVPGDIVTLFLNTTLGYVGHLKFASLT